MPSTTSRRPQARWASVKQFPLPKTGVCLECSLRVRVLRRAIRFLAGLVGLDTIILRNTFDVFVGEPHKFCQKATCLVQQDG